MTPNSPIPTSEQALEREFTALWSLLADEDPAVYDAVRERILLHGHQGAEWLKRQCIHAAGLRRKRVREILDLRLRQKADDGFVHFCQGHGEDFDIESAAWLLAQTRYPEIHSAAYMALLDLFADEIRERLAGIASGVPQLKVINQYLFSTLGFKGNETDYYHPENSYLNKVIDRRLGNPISLCLIYLFICRRLGLPLVGIGMPSHFLCRYKSSEGEIYIDVFGGGRFMTRADCIRFLNFTQYGFQKGFLSPITPRRTLMRICANLHQIHSRRQDGDETARFQRYIVTLAR